MVPPPVTLREYVPADHLACLRVFDSNVPAFFSMDERALYAAFLSALPGPYFVLVDPAQTVVGCGGYAVGERSDVADLCWGMVSREHHGRGFGRALTEMRVQRMWREPGIKAVALNTTQHTVAFYERLGFRTRSVLPDGYAPGLDRCEMLMTRKTVEVVAYDEAWPRVFLQVRAELASALGAASSRIDHVGSTSVPGLAAKPIIDILVETPSLSLIDAAIPEMVGLGYEARGEYGIEGRRYFSRPGGPGLKVQVHAYESVHPALARHVLFRDYLRAHPTEAERYGEVKLALASQHAGDRDAYQAAKADFIGRVETRAVGWWGRGP